MCAKVASANKQTSDQLTESVLARLTELIKTSGQSESALSLAIGRNRGWLSHRLRNGTVPNFVDMSLIANIAGFDLSDLLPSDPGGATSTDFTYEFTQDLQARFGFDRPDAHAIIKWHLDNNGILQDHDWFEEYIELFAEPDLEIMTPRPVFLGRSSIAARLLKLQSIEEFQKFIEFFDEASRTTVAQEHNAFLKNQRVSIEPRRYAYQVSPGHSGTISLLRVLLPVRSQSNEKLIMNFSVPTEIQETYRNDPKSEVGSQETAMPSFRRM